MPTYSTMVRAVVVEERDYWGAEIHELVLGFENSFVSEKR